MPRVGAQGAIETAYDCADDVARVVLYRLARAIMTTTAPAQPSSNAAHPGNRLARPVGTTAVSAVTRRPRRLPASLGDGELLRLIQDGDAEAFEQLYHRHSALAVSIALRILRSHAAAEDVVQEAFLSLWRSSHRYSPALGAPRSWLAAIVRHRAIDAVRRDKAKFPPPPDDHINGGLERTETEAAPERTDAQVLERETRRMLLTALGSLPPSQRFVVELAYFRGLSHAEIGKELGLPLGTVKGRIRLGLRKLETFASALEGLGASAAEPGR